MAGETPFGSVTIQVCVSDVTAGVAFYTKLFGKPPDFEPFEDFKEWKLTPGAWFQVGQGVPRPTYTMRFRVDDFDGAMVRAERDLGIKCERIRRIEGIVMLCDFADPWGNRLGFYQPYPGKHRVPGGKFRDDPTHVPAAYHRDAP
jgi:predicted enzyme related to lactoylglutathione lyase